MNIYLIRHGETTGDVEDRYGGDYDDHLSEKGIQQSERLAQKLKGKGIQLIYTSTRMRATETAEIVQKGLGLDIKSVHDLRERNNYGILTGMTKSEAKKNYPKAVAELAIGIHHHVKDSESYEQFKMRIITAFERITSTKYNCIAIITHGGPISCIAREILKEEITCCDCTILEMIKTGSTFKLIK